MAALGAQGMMQKPRLMVFNLNSVVSQQLSPLSVCWKVCSSDDLAISFVDSSVILSSGLMRSPCL